MRRLRSMTICLAVLTGCVETPTGLDSSDRQTSTTIVGARVIDGSGSQPQASNVRLVGDQIVTVRIVMPDEVDDELAYFFSQWKQTRSYDPGPR